MNEACALKVRQYLMHRIPTILGYLEAQEELRSAPYVLNIGNYPDNVSNNIEKIKEFSLFWQNKRIKDYLSFLTKNQIETKRIEFFKDIISLSF